MTVPATKLWFAIEAAFSEIQNACNEAHAVALMKVGEPAEVTFALPMSSPEQSSSSGKALRPSIAFALSRDVKFRKEHAAGLDLVQLRQRIRDQLVQLRRRLLEGLPENEADATIQPLIIFADELASSVKVSPWQSLYGELYEREDGGEHFYTMLENRLTRQETHPLIYQVYYFCLRAGFIGKYDGDREAREGYEKRLALQIPLSVLPPMRVDRPPAHVEAGTFPWDRVGIYAVAVVVVLCVMGVLYAAA